MLTNCKSSPTFPAGQLSQISSVISWEPKTIKKPCTFHDCNVHYLRVSGGNWTIVVVIPFCVHLSPVVGAKTDTLTARVSN